MGSWGPLLKHATKPFFNTWVAHNTDIFSPYEVDNQS